MGMNMVGALVGGADTDKAFIKTMQLPKGTEGKAQILTNF